MQTFLPYSCFYDSASVLDNKRLGKQRVEAMQIIDILEGRSKNRAWINHPAVKMWAGYVDALKLYCNRMIQEWERRGFKNTMVKYKLNKQFEFPKWLGNSNFHKSHRSNLLRKNRQYYSQYFEADLDSSMEYEWNEEYWKGDKNRKDENYGKY